MKGDFSRKTFDKSKNYSGVLKQQGRVSLEADWNEQIDIIGHEREARTEDTIGGCGAPDEGGGFRIEEFGVSPKGLRIIEGRFYAGGQLCEPRLHTKVPLVDFPAANQVKLASATADGRRFAVGDWVAVVHGPEDGRQVARISGVDPDDPTLLTLDPQAYNGPKPAFGYLQRLLLYDQQVDYPLRDDDALTPGRNLVYLDVWKRHITAIEDPGIREKALGGPDTATRVQTVSQVRIHPAADSASEDACCSAWTAFQSEIASRKSGARLKTVAGPTPVTDLCHFAAAGGYKGLENRLYRVEIHGAIMVCAVAARAGGLDCFARGRDGHMWHTRWDGVTQTWSAWEDLGGVLSSAPAVASWGTNRLDCFVRGTDNHMWHKWWNGSAWSGWEDLGGVLSSAPAVASQAADRLDCFVRGADGHLWHKCWNGTTWGGWGEDPHDEGIAPVTYKWSRDNGSVVFPIVEFSADTVGKVTLAGVRKDQVPRLQPGDWVEVSDDTTDLKGEHGTLVQIEEAFDEATGAVVLKEAVGGYAVDAHAKLRRWDIYREPNAAPEDDAYPVPVPVGPIELEDGVMVEFAGANFQVGDYWVFAARTVDGSVEELNFELPQGIEHHYCPLALVTWGESGFSVISDCRNRFVPLTGMTSFTLAGGDGQEVGPGDVFPQPLRVLVARGSSPVEGARVEFNVEGVSGQLWDNKEPDPSNRWKVSRVVATDASGVAQLLAGAKCSPECPPGPIRVTATLLEAPGSPCVGEHAAVLCFNLYLADPIIFYGGGDGQSGPANQDLPAKLRVIVSPRPQILPNGIDPLPFVGPRHVLFEVSAGGGSVQPPSAKVPLEGSTEWVAESTWRLGDALGGTQQVKAWLVTDEDDASKRWKLGSPIVFTARVCSGVLERCPKFLDELRSDGIVRDAQGNLGFDVTWADEPLEVMYAPGVAYVGGCRFDITEGGVLQPNESATHQAVLVDIDGNVRLIYKDPLPEKYALVAFVSTYQGRITQVVDVRRDLYHLDEQVQLVRESAAARRPGRQQFIPLLASTLRDVRYRDGRVREFNVKDPQGLAFDGKSVWVASSRNQGQVVKIDRDAAAPSAGEKVPMVIGNRRYLTSRAAFDGHRYIWFTSSGYVLAQKVLPKAPSLVAVGDIVDWPGFILSLTHAGKAAEPSPGKRVWEMLPADTQKAVEESVASGTIQAKQKAATIKALNDSILGRSDFYEAGYFSGVTLPTEAKSLLADPASLSARDVQRVNRFLLEEAIVVAEPKTDATGTLVLVDTLRTDAPRIAVTVGVGPDAIAFDGDFMWVGCQDRKLYVVNCETREVVRTVDTGRGMPEDLLFDGQYVWAACSAEAEEGKLWRIEKPWGEPTDFSAIVTGSPSRIAFDGAKVWLAQRTQGSQEHSILSFNPLKPKQEVRIGATGLTGVRALFSDGRYVWVTHTWAMNEGPAFGMTRIDPAVNAVAGQVELPGKLVPAHGLFDGTHVWLSSGPDAKNALEYVRKVLLL